MGRYNCPKCDWFKDVYYDTGKDIREIIDHDNTHLVKGKIERREDKIPCERCDGNGYTLDVYDIEVDVSETDQGRNK